ncbi:uncharacterized protein ACLA_047280 [Aspergillus clavatus NRRL 1]|uniref:Uncharacterized protein n=1 Tax=Aspergillus clavatus (strain ATCC 1007 / CBS 513.65 / DSM 816 / NCTC 3887 / NRRL 1 / QM 1276 / 107) TaxID=344612 RepID=A1CHA4_ASPCL|nr:uncharacterized protein ACLA_047280 [Aspergillus clavatus NRRL 1]EAW10259.1 conserved hypothetical protein [Aspergillus clavatus NRRL 1]
MPEQDPQSILSRLDRIEALLGIGKIANSPSSLTFDSDLEDESNSVSFQGLWKAVEHLKVITRPPQDHAIWAHSIVTRLWSSPSSEFASLAGGYLVATCNAVAELVMPNSMPGSPGWVGHPATSGPSDDHKVFQDIHGLVMASLSCEAYIETTDKWIALAYRLLLDHCPPNLDGTIYDWRGLFSGLQVVDIEHASMHMCYPLLPREPLVPALQELGNHQECAFRGLAQMMHHGLSHFVGRKLPTIWSFVSARETDALPPVGTPFTEKDSQVIRLWAKKLDEWLVQYNGASQPSPSDRQGILILLQYHLHKLYVLSIYHPARGFDLGFANITLTERQELLMSARAVLRLRQDDASIWSNWDLILNSLKRSDPSAPSIHGVLADRLQCAMQSMHTPPEIGPDFAFPAPNMDYSWTIFDQQIIALANPPWLFDDSSIGQAQKHVERYQ